MVIVNYLDFTNDKEIIMRCEKLDGCLFYQGKMQVDSGLGKMYRERYCEGDKTHCARYLVAVTLGSSFVPGTLFPNMVQKAEQIIAENSKSE